MSYVFLKPKKFDLWSKNVIFGHIFGLFPVKFQPEEKTFWKIFIAPKDSSLNRGTQSPGLFVAFVAIVLISAVMSISEDLLPARPVAVNEIKNSDMMTKSTVNRCYLN